MIPSIYATLVNEPNRPVLYSKEAAEKKNSYHILTERHLQAMWLEQKYFKSLTTSNNETVEVISPGIWNSEAGPDFLKAHIKIGGKEWRGDIELHLSQESWYHHNHHLDPNYNNVILHVCYWQPFNERPSLTKNGKVLPSVYLQPSLTIPEARIIKLIDLDLYPYKFFSGSGSCSRTLFNYLPKDKTTNLLRSAAAWRLKEKNERLQEKIDSPQHYLIGGIAMALGYKHNAEAFLTIFNHLRAHQEISSLRIQAEQSILCQALGLGNFFNPHFQKKWQESVYYQELFNSFHEDVKAKSPFFVSLKLDKIRPANHPARRLAALAKIMTDPEIVCLKSKLLSLWHSHWHLPNKQRWKNLKESFIALIPSYHDDYWEWHYTFEKEKQAKPIAIIGTDLKREILVNTCLPILYADIDERGTDEEKEAFTDFYSSLSAPKTKKSAYLNHRFFGGKQQKPLFSRADLQQGAYQIHRDFCIHFEASCQGCPFVERYKNLFRIF